MNLKHLMTDEKKESEKFCFEHFERVKTVIDDDFDSLFFHFGLLCSMFLREKFVLSCNIKI